MEFIATEQAPAAIGPYSQAVKCGNFLFTSGQIPLTKDGERVTGDIEVQTKQVLQNLQAVLDEAGATVQQVVKATVFLTDLTNFARVNELYGDFFQGHAPARSCVQVAALPKGVDIEIELIVALT
ncbi:RidA family protein [Numidum massiliense]|uniref:RidA family protein n=1 Tax=Numidum massiliense TaxID=1522315 RepID=UPI0006D58D94|nr:RidA family protein [Numidum massiliense]